MPKYYIGTSESDSVSQEAVRVCDKDTELEFSSSTFPHITGSLSLLQAHDQNNRQTSCWPKHTIRLRIKNILHMWRVTSNLRIYIGHQFYLFIRLLLPEWVRCPRLFPDECQWLKVWMLFFPIQEDAWLEGNIDWTNCVIPNVCSFNIKLIWVANPERVNIKDAKKEKQAFNKPCYIVSITLIQIQERSEKPASLSSCRGNNLKNKWVMDIVRLSFQRIAYFQIDRGCCFEFFYHTITSPFFVDKIPLSFSFGIAFKINRLLAGNSPLNSFLFRMCHSVT